jgi:4-hydroxybenzoate polyprenyltransferase/chlorophyll synthase
MAEIMNLALYRGARALGLVYAREIVLGWREARPVVQVIFQLRFITGAAFAIHGSSARPGHIVAGAAAWLGATWSIYLLNGICDQTEDRRNGLSRPLSTGELPVPTARLIVLVLALAALGTGALVSWRFAVLVVLMLVLGWVYSAGPRPQKAHAAGFAVVVTGGGLITFLAGWYAARGAGLPGQEFWTLACAMSLWMGLAGNTKDLDHVRGDRAAGRRTLPLLLGDAPARWVIAGLTLSLGVASLTLAATTAPALLPAAVVLLAGACAVAASLAAAGPASPQDARRRPYRMFMITQYAVHATVLALLAASYFLGSL